MTDRNDKSRHTRRKVLKTTGAASVVGTIGLAGCTEDGNGGSDGTGTGGGNDGGNGGNESPKLKVTGVWSGDEQKDFQAVLDHAREDTGLEVQYHPRTTNALLTGTLMDYESGVAPADIVVMPSPARIQSDGKAGHLASVGETWNPDNFAPDPSRVSNGGNVYAAPFKMDIKPGFWYRKSFFEEHDLSEPGSYDEFKSLLATISGIDGVDAPLASGGGVGWPLSDQTEAFFLRQENGAALQEGLISGDVDFTDDRVTTALQEIVDLHKEGYFSVQREFGTQYEYLWDGAIPLYFQGSFTPAQEAIKDASDLGVFRLPGTKGVTGSVNWLTIPSYSENVDAAKKLLSSIVSADGQQIWAERGGFIATNTQVPKSAYSVEIMAQLTQLSTDVTVVPDLDDALGNPFQEEFWSQLKGLWSDPSSNLGDIQQALDKAQDESIKN